MAQNTHHHLNYLELPATDLDASKAFFATVFAWSFVDYGPDYTCVTDQALAIGLFRSELHAQGESGSALPVLYSADLDASLDAVKAAGGVIVKPTFEFPGGKRFHFHDPSGNEFAVWAE